MIYQMTAEQQHALDGIEQDIPNAQTLAFPQILDYVNQLNEGAELVWADGSIDRASVEQAVAEGSEYQSDFSYLRTLPAEQIKKRLDSFFDGMAAQMIQREFNSNNEQLPEVK